ncbi:Histidine--tRNA ligase, cytoplasmic [Orchesella cincta]|uniref:histidine--tRNA ligase n=1 Tax=Orchesella cincta TaxID=48709 RepID=A0A1D2MBN2_ORCCI|nr:Histidine--tRNA ligase, cytoplasmic [Orchesella cincta]
MTSMDSQEAVFEAYVKYQSEKLKQLKADSRVSEFQLRHADMELEQAKKRLKGGSASDSALVSNSVILKVPKGTRDFGPAQMRLRSEVLDKITDVFKRHGATQLDTPVFELKDILTGKYGDDSKLIYDLKDQGGEILSLRYDLTVPFARYVAMNKISSIKRYQIAKVYRRDNPAIGRGRYREFYQCDFDIAGQYDSMIPDAECVKLLDEILSCLDVGPYVIKLNHRKILDGIFEVAEIAPDSFRGVSSTIDKLDKSTWEEVAEELRSLRKLNKEQIATIAQFVRISGPLPKVLNILMTNSKFMSSSLGREGIDSMIPLIQFVQIMGVEERRTVFDLSLARGLDYYTGIIYEAVVTSQGDSLGVGIGSVAGGGRYDELVGMFDANQRQVPCVGVSIGVERIFSILELKQNDSKKAGHVQVYVTSAQKGMAEQRLRLVEMLWKAGIKAEVSYKPNPKLLQQLQYCEENNIPLAIVIGEDEVQRKVVKLRNVKERKEDEVSESEMVAELKKRLDMPLDVNSEVKRNDDQNCNLE